MHENRLPVSPSPDVRPPIESQGNVFANSRGEIIDSNLRLVVDPTRGTTWEAYANQGMPVELFRTCGLIGEGSEGWGNLVEHSMFVTAAARTLAQELQQRGVGVDLNVVERAAWAHDATKRNDVMKGLTREDESKDDVHARVLKEFGYSEAEIAAAKNTGRLPDRYLTDPVERRSAIADHSIEATVVGYVDARTRGARIATIPEAQADSIAKKPKDADFFNNNWAPYYEAVEDYLRDIAPGFDPDMLTDDAIFATVQTTVAPNL